MPGSLLRRLGLAGGNFDSRLAAAIVWAVLGLYALGYAAFYPRVFTNNDEGRYAAETRAFLDTGSIYVPKLHPLTGEIEKIVPGDYPFGMIALMAPFVKAFGERGAFLPSFLCLLIAVLVTARWLRDEGRSPLFALIPLAFPAAIVAGRLAMSDTARMAAAALGLWLFFRGLDRARPAAWLASGLVAGATLSLRESAVLPFIPLFAGAALRWDRGWGWLLLGGLLGTGLHLAGNQLLFGDAFFVRGQARLYPFDIDVWSRLWLYLVGLLVFVPGGLVLGLLYRGRRRAEIVGTIALFFSFYLFQSYGMTESGPLKRVVIALRYFLPLLPVLAFAMAESLPRWLERLAWRSHGTLSFERYAGAMAALWIAGVALGAVTVHPAFARWSASQAEIRDAIQRSVPRDAVMIGNGAAIRKFIDEYSRDYVTLVRRELAPEQARQLLERHGEFHVVFLDRSDSDYWRADAAHNAEFVAALPSDPTLLVDIQPTRTDRLRIWRVARSEVTAETTEASLP
jgi:4-amino-4-deoxy-L-arabinose transferase-like glycosyltransferase